MPTDHTTAIRFASLAQAAQRLGVSPQTVRRRADRGELPFISTSHGWLLFAQVVEQQAKAPRP